MEPSTRRNDAIEEAATPHSFVAAVIESAMDCIVIMNHEGLIIEFNPAAEAAFGISRQEALGREMADLIIPERYRERHRQGLASFLQTGQARILRRRIELAALRANGEEFPVELTVTQLPTNGSPAFAGFIRDITDRQSLETALRERAERAAYYQTVLVELAKLDSEDLDEALREITRIDARALGVSRVSAWFFDRDQAGLTCRSLFDAEGGHSSEGFRIAAADYPKYFQALRRKRVIAARDAWTDPDTSEFTEMYLKPLAITSMLDVPIWRRGKMVGIVCHEHRGAIREWLQEEQDFAGSVADMVAIAIEAEEQRRAERDLHKAHEELQQAHEELERRVEERTEQLRLTSESAERANKAKSEFLSRMSHELRTPMNSILGFAQVLARKNLPPAEQKSVDHILKAGRHLLELINEVLDLSRIEANRMRLSEEPVRIGHVVHETLSMVEPLAGELGIELVDGVSNKCDFFVMADRQRLTQVLINFVSNGIKYNRRGGSVRLDCESVDADRMRILVTDSGQGIPPEKMSRLFSPFDRLDAESYGVEGTGLGLALSKRLVEAMGGTVGVKSEQGVGTVFWLDLKLTESPQARSQRNRKSREPEEGAPSVMYDHTLLYIEDNLANFSLIETILGDRPGLRLLSAMQGGIGLEMAERHLPDLILLDLHLPDRNGEQVLASLKGNPHTREIPVVMVSADATPGQVERLQAAGAHRYLTKPLDVDRFLEVLDSILKSSGH